MFPGQSIAINRRDGRGGNGDSEPEVDKRVWQWHDHVTSTAAFGKVLDGILVVSRPKPSDICVDLGAGSGFVTTALAPLVASVIAVDISPAMTEALAQRAMSLL